ncbi:adenylyl-sulfate kinase [Neobacillus sp. 19]|uniref:adenylyl-sulfate kinase n=1 Tax=Neobacillus sp. 19 TaxID=3394458 RepID=UPI003BF62616
MNHTGESENNVFWHQSAIKKEDREKQHGHKSIMIWFTGLSGSGKSTIANALQHKLFQKGISVYLLDGDNLRHGINKNLSFTAEDRQENIRRTAEIGRLFVDAGVVVLAALISPYEKERLNARALFQQDEFIEVYIKCSLQECENRDPKGLYKKARKGEIKHFTGIDQPYEEPKNPEVVIDTNKLSIDDSVERLLSYLLDQFHLIPNAKE